MNHPGPLGEVILPSAAPIALWRRRRHSHYIGLRVRPALLAIAIAVACGPVLAGCGNSPTRAPNPLKPRPLGTLTPERFPAAGLDVYVPSSPGWSLTLGPSPLLVQALSGTASIAIWSYPRSEPLPRGQRAFRAARQALLAQDVSRDPTFLLRSAVFTRAGGYPAIELLARETVAGQLRAVRSLHVYAHGTEYVIDALSPPSAFRHVDRRVFLPVIATLRLPRPR